MESKHKKNVQKNGRRLRELFKKPNELDGAATHLSQLAGEIRNLATYSQGGGHAASVNRRGKTNGPCGRLFKKRVANCIVCI